MGLNKTCASTNVDAVVSSLPTATPPLGGVIFRGHQPNQPSKPDRSLMRYHLTMLAGIAFACAVCGCSIFPRYRYHYYENSSSSDATPKDPPYVTVELDGDVRLHGP